jgi:hypothetical protein
MTHSEAKLFYPSTFSVCDQGPVLRQVFKTKLTGTCFQPDDASSCHHHHLCVIIMEYVNVGLLLFIILNFLVNKLLSSDSSNVANNVPRSH